MHEQTPILDPATYRRRAEVCREKATLYSATRDDFLMAAATWDALADQAEALIRYRDQLKPSEG
jgi:hypothetical protein